MDILCDDVISEHRAWKNLVSFYKHVLLLGNKSAKLESVKRDRRPSRSPRKSGLNAFWTRFKVYTDPNQCRLWLSIKKQQLFFV